ncbi:MAG: flavodoxin family protein [Dehalococcoidales bacterium]|nr:flavodoxin family protein [Dehalococcoidales bacterium]
MRVLIIVDSVYGNTEKIAGAIAGALTPAHEVKVVSTARADIQELSSYNLVVVGSPTQGGRALKSTQDFLYRVPSVALKNVSVAAFDTRIKTAIVKIFGFAAGRIADVLKSKGGTLVAPAQGFFVKGREGPLLDGEIERAAAWAGELIRK